MQGPVRGYYFQQAMWGDRQEEEKEGFTRWDGQGVK